MIVFITVYYHDDDDNNYYYYYYYCTRVSLVGGSGVRGAVVHGVCQHPRIQYVLHYYV